MSSQSLFTDLARGIKLGIELSTPHIIHNYIKVPLGVLAVMITVYAVNQALLLAAFPASVACMVLLYLSLLISPKVLGSRRTSQIIRLFDIPGKFCLQWIALFFTPAFITLPLSTPISAKEAMIIAAVFVVGFAVQISGAAYLCVFLQWLLGVAKEKKGHDDDELVLLTDDANLEVTDEENGPDPLTFLGHDLEEPIRAAQPLHPSISIDETQPSPLFTSRDIVRQIELPHKYIIIGQWIHRHFDILVFTTGFLVSLPIYFTIGYAMPLHLFTAILCFLFMMHAPPPRYKMVLNPVLCSVVLSWFFFYIFSLCRGVTFLDDLTQYKTGRTYLALFHTPHTQVIRSPPGAGDVLTSLMDVSIVSLAMPMYAHRADLKRNLFTLLPTIFTMAAGSFFIYPPICHLVGISSERALGFAGRSMTLALGTPFTQALGGSVPLMACTTVFTAILGPLIGPFLLGPRVLRIKEEDFVTRGATLGLSSGAITTAFLLRSDPRAAAMSSVSFVLFGTLMVVMASIPPIAEMLRNWVGL